jgi:hypothetical protein
MFSEGIWGLGALSNSGEDFIIKLQHQIAPLWQNQLL